MATKQRHRQGYESPWNGANRERLIKGARARLQQRTMAHEARFTLVPICSPQSVLTPTGLGGENPEGPVAVGIPGVRDLGKQLPQRRQTSLCKTNTYKYVGFGVILEKWHG